MYNCYKPSFISGFLSAEYNVDITVVSTLAPSVLYCSTGSQMLNRLYWKNDWHTDIKCTIPGEMGMQGDCRKSCVISVLPAMERGKIAMSVWIYFNRKGKGIAKCNWSKFKKHLTDKNLSMCNVIFMINILAKQALGSFPLRLFFNVVVGLSFISLKLVGGFVKKQYL